MAATTINVSEVEECRNVAATWAPTLHALGHPDRLLIALWLARNTRSVRELEGVTGMSQSLVSYHLRELREAGIVNAVAEGRSNRYRLCCADLDEVASLIGTLETAAAADAPRVVKARRGSRSAPRRRP
jgi:DNA-binding transcriptional ArsR family regulator